MKMRLALVLGASLLLASCSDPLDKLVISQGTIASCADITTSSSSNMPMELICLDGKSSVDVANLQGPAVVNVWASWCPPCVGEMEYFRQLQANKPESLLLLGINMEEAKTTDGTNFIIENGITWPNLADAHGLTKSLNGTGVPVTLFIDASGSVVHREMGAFKSYHELTTRIDDVLGIQVS
jgi:thiol-disulfide isomerase/thioredoxin